MSAQNEYFKCVIKIEYEGENGKTKYRKEEYLINAIGPTDVETKINEYIGVGFDFEITNISKTNIISVIS